jgi:hypothetical protein
MGRHCRYLAGNGEIGERDPTDADTNLRECKADLYEYVRKIVDFEPNLAPQGATGRKLDKIAKGAFRLMMEIRGLDPAMREKIREKLGATDIIANLRQLRDASAGFKPTRVKRTGGSQRRRTDRAIKRHAAKITCEILFEWCYEMPSITKTSRWIQLTEILAEVATGRDLGSAFRACTDYLKGLEDWHVFGRESRREFREEGRRRSEKTAIPIMIVGGGTPPAL